MSENRSKGCGRVASTTPVVIPAATATPPITAAQNQPRLYRGLRSAADCLGGLRSSLAQCCACSRSSGCSAAEDAAEEAVS